MMHGHHMQAKYFGSGRLTSSSQDFGLTHPGPARKGPAESAGLKIRPNSTPDMDDDTNPLFISAVRIFLDFVRDKQSIVCPEKTCSLEELIRYLADFQDEARTKKGERYSPSTIRVIRYSLNRVIALGRNQQEMRPYPTQTTGVRKKRKLEDSQSGKMDHDHENAGSGHHHEGGARAGGGQAQRTPLNTMARDRCDSFASGSGGDQFAPQLSPYNIIKSQGGSHHQSSPDSSIKAMQHSIETFRNWLSDQGVSPIFESFSDEQIDDQLVSFLRFGKTKAGKDFSRGAMQTFRLAITQYLKQHSGIELASDPMFEPTREAFHRALAASPSIALDKKPFHDSFSNGFAGTEWLGIPVECIKDLYRSGALSVATAATLQRKVWLELTIFFRAIPCCPDQIFWNRNTFKIASGDHGVKYVELNPDVYNRYGCTIDRMSEQSSCIMVQRTGSPYCPVASFELYLQALDPSCENLFALPRPRTDLETEYYRRSGQSREIVRYSSEPLTSAHLATVMESIAQAAKLPFHFSCLSAAETDHVAWMRALTALELELQCQGLQFSFPVAPLSAPSRSASSSSTESISCPQRTSVIQAAPRVYPVESVSARPAAVPDSVGESWMDRDNGAYHTRSPTDVRGQDNMSPEAIDLVWRKKMKLVGGTRGRSDTDISAASQASSCSVGSEGQASSGTPRFELGGAPITVKEQQPVPPSPPHTITLPARNSTKDESSNLRATCSSGEKDEVTAEEFKSLYSTGVFDPDQADTLQNKTLFELMLNYGRLAPFPKRLKLWTKNLFQLMKVADGRKFVALASAVSEHESPVIYARPNSKHCPMAGYEKYMNALLSTSKLLFPKVLPSAVTTEWYSAEAPDVPDVNAYLANITKAAKFPRTLTFEILNKTALKNWTDALDQLDNPSAGSQIPFHRSCSEKSNCSESVRPTVKRILEHYRKSKESSEDRDMDESVKKIAKSIEPDDCKRVQVHADSANQLKRPLIIVRPQIVVLKNCNETAALNRAELKEMISAALHKAITSDEWERQIEEAIALAQGSVSESGDGSESADDLVFHKQANVEVEGSRQVHPSRGARRTVEYHAAGRFNRSIDEDATSKSSMSSDDEPVLYIADSVEEAVLRETIQHADTDEAHGSHRRKAFMPIKHSE